MYADPIVFKIAGGTPRSDRNLCSTCRFVHRRRGALTGREAFRCESNYQNPVILTEPIAECSRYADARLPSLEMMQEIAWSVMTDKGGRKIGFLSPEDIRRRGSGPDQRPVGF